MPKLIETMFIISKCKNCGEDVSIFCFIVNSEFMFNEQFVKKTSKDYFGLLLISFKKRFFKI